MKFLKQPLTLDQQVALLQSRGLEGDATSWSAKLRDVSYYRLAGYTFPFRKPDDTFRPGTTFDLVWRHYAFDRQLRLLVLDAIERVEVSVRTRLSYELAHEHGPFGLWDRPTALAIPSQERATLLIRLREEVERNKKEQFLKHFFGKYGDEHSDPPVWMVTEVLSFGNVVRLVDTSTQPVRRKVTGSYGVPDEVLVSWLRTLNFVRNVCAHHSRLWNRVLAYRVKLPAKHKYPSWHQPVTFTNDHVFVVLTILRYLLSIVSPGSRWTDRLRELLDEYPDVSRSAMGFPSGWETSDLWR